MSVLVMTCPHCAAENMTFNVVSDASHRSLKNHRSALALCANCDMPVVAQGAWSKELHQIPHSGNLTQQNGNLFTNPLLNIQNVWPKPNTIDAPQNLPDKILRAYIEAATARRSKLWNSCCGAYRRCMELALKEFAPDVEAWKLEKRIDKLAAEHKITPDLKNWAHELRLDGNEAIHGEEDATQEIADQMHHLTYFLLTYLYTLPKQVEAARTRRTALDAG